MSTIPTPSAGAVRAADDQYYWIESEAGLQVWLHRGGNVWNTFNGIRIDPDIKIVQEIPEPNTQIIDRETGAAKLADALEGLIAEYEDRKAQFGGEYLWDKHENVHVLLKADAALAAWKEGK